MIDKDKEITTLRQEAAKWKNRALEAAERACYECEQIFNKCEECRIEKIKKEASGR